MQTAPVTKEMIPTLLIELSKLYFRQLNPEKDAEAESDVIPGSGEINLASPSSYQCSSCLTVYDELLGDSVSEIPPGVAFADLPESFKCSVCVWIRKERVQANNLDHARNGD